MPTPTTTVVNRADWPLWRVQMVAPVGVVIETLELRAPAESIAVDQARRHRPEWTVHAVERRPICR